MELIAIATILLLSMALGLIGARTVLWAVFLFMARLSMRVNAAEAANLRHVPL